MVRYPAVVFLQETGVLPPRIVFHCLYWHMYIVVSSSSAGVAILDRRDSQLQIGGFTHHPNGTAIVLELTYRETPMQVVNVYMSAKGTAKEYCPLLQWLCAHVAPDLKLVLMGGHFQCNLGWSADCVSVSTEIAPVLSEFAADMALLPFTHGMCGPTWVSAQGFVGVLDFFLSHRVSPEVGTVHVENESVFPSDHYPVWLHVHTLLALVAPGNPASRARFKLGTSVCKWQQETFADRCAGLHSLPPAATPEAYRHFVCVLTAAPEAAFGPPKTPDTVPGLVSIAAKGLHALLKAHCRWWLNAPLIRKVVAARKTFRQAWEVVGLERSLEVVPLAQPGGVTGPAKSDYRCLMRKPYTARIEPTHLKGTGTGSGRAWSVPSSPSPSHSPLQ